MEGGREREAWRQIERERHGGREGERGMETDRERKAWREGGRERHGDR